MCVAPKPEASSGPLLMSDHTPMRRRQQCSASSKLPMSAYDSAVTRAGIQPSRSSEARRGPAKLGEALVTVAPEHVENARQALQHGAEGAEQEKPEQRRDDERIALLEHGLDGGARWPPRSARGALAAEFLQEFVRLRQDCRPRVPPTPHSRSGPSGRYRGRDRARTRRRRTAARRWSSPRM